MDGGAVDGVGNSVDRVGQGGGAEDGVVHGGHGGDNGVGNGGSDDSGVSNGHGGDSGHGGNSGHGGDSGNSGSGNNSVVTKTGVAEASVSQTSVSGVAKTVSVVSVVSIGIGLSLGLSLPLPPAGHGSAEVVGAEPDVAGVDGAGGGGHDSVDRVGESVQAESGVAESSVAETVVTGEDDLGVSLGLPLAVVSGVAVVVSVADGTGDGHVGGVHAGGALVSDDVSVAVSVSVSGVSKTVSVVSVVGISLGLGLGLPLAVLSLYFNSKTLTENSLVNMQMR